MAETNVPTPATADQTQRASALEVLNLDARLARAAWAAALGLHADHDREPAEEGLIALLELLADRLDERCDQLDPAWGVPLANTAIPESAS